MKKKLELQTIIVLVCVLAIAGAWIGIQVGRDSLGLWSAPNEIEFKTDDLLGLAPRSEIRCAGAVIGHVRRVTPALTSEGSPEFTLTAGLKKEFAGWKFEPAATVKAGVVASSLAPASITMKLSNAPDAIAAVNPREGRPPVVTLGPETSDSGLDQVMVRVRNVADEVERTVRKFTEPQNGRTISVVEEFSLALPSVAASLHHLHGITQDAARQMADDGRLNLALGSLQKSIAQLQILTEETTKTVTMLNKRIDSSLDKLDGLVVETTGTMTATRGKVERLGDTFVGRMFIAKPEASPTPEPTPRRSR